ncbi:MAG: hypothetical protein K2G79_09205 [Muribaculum sp.]|nr:hypothetical protein [Muribaculum sp.]
MPGVARRLNTKALRTDVKIHLASLLHNPIGNHDSSSWRPRYINNSTR